MEIALAKLEDMPRILELSNWAAAHTSANFATQPEALDQWLETWKNTSARHPWLVARAESNEIVGFAKSSPHRSRGAYNWIAEVSVYVAPERHGQKIGTALYQRLMPLLAAQGYVMLLAGITDGHAASERLHKNFGFVRCGTFRRAGWKFGRWHDVGYWELSLQPEDYIPAPIRPVAEVFAPADVTGL